MFGKLKISTKLILLVFFLVAIGILSVSLISYNTNKKSLETEYLSRLKLISNVYQENIDHFFDNTEKEMTYILRNEDLTNNFQALNKYAVRGGDTAKLYRDFYHSIFRNFQELNQYEDLYLLSEKGTILFQYSDSISTGHKFKNIDNQIIDLNIKKFHVKKSIYEGKNFYIYATHPLLTNDGKLTGVLVSKIDARKILTKTKPTLPDIDNTIEILTYKLHKNDIYRMSESSLPIKLFYKDNSDDPLHISVKKMKSEVGSGYFKHVDDSENLAVWKHDDALDIGILIKIKLDNVYSSLQRFNAYTVLTAVCILIVSLILSNFFSRFLTYPILKLKKVLGLVSHGILPKEMITPLQDEVGEMIVIVNKIVKSLKKTAAFAQKIGEGDFKTHFKPISNKDILGHALLDMSESLQKANSKDNLRNWIVTGVAEIGGILRNNTTISELGDAILEYICKRTNAIQGAFFIADNIDNQDYLLIKSSYAYNKKKHIKAKFKFGEGLIGQAAIEKDLILRTEVPENFTTITSGILGDQQASSILIIPLITNDIVYGVIELAGFEPFTEGDAQFMKEVSEIIARTIFNIKVNENTKRLLEESQRMSSELKVQQEELKQNAIEMEASQIEIQNTNEELEKQINEVNNAQARIQALLQNASEVIIIYDNDGVIRYVSPSLEPILGYEESDLVGKKDFNLINKSEQVLYSEMFEKLIETPSQTVSIQISYFKKTGDLIWLEATGRNLIKDPAINGIVVNYRNITERRRAEEEEKKRGQMQALSENSVDLIIRLSDKGKFFYVNPTITNLTGKKQEDLLNKTIEEIDINESIKIELDQICKQVFSSSKKSTKEINFPTLKGNRIMSLNAIPEFGYNDKINSILLVAHDITEAKEIENEIKDKNQKINDSINYAENIQEAILPDNALISKALPQSAIFFKPRDVVSGDFPWFKQKGDDIYIAAVDCTGHGVPGALISLVGYFLLNNIVENADGLSASQVLDALDKSVTDTFKQNIDSSKIKDGMDIALCKINLKNKSIEYAGANRPLYLVSSNGTLQEYKGDKFPIGGGKAYVNKTEFTNNQFNFTEGDSIYFFSDGLPDQFGGHDGSQKLGTKKVKEILAIESTSIDTVMTNLNNTFEEWKKNTKQTDDVLLIGIRF